MSDPDTLRAELLESWESSAGGWGRMADQVRDWGMPVSASMIENLNLQPGERVLELAAGPGDTGFLAAELIRPGGTLICSDGAEAMLEVARARAAAAGLSNVEFRQLQLEWIDMETATVDAIICRWGIMLAVDPSSVASEMRRVLRPGGRLAVAVWDELSANPWMTVPRRALAEIVGEPSAPAPAPARAGAPAPGPFALAEPGQLPGLLENAGFAEIEIRPVELRRRFPSSDAFLEETLSLSTGFRSAWEELGEGERTRVAERLRELSNEFAGGDGGLVIGGRSLVGIASA